jgi:Ferritin-like domain
VSAATRRELILRGAAAAGVAALGAGAVVPEASASSPAGDDDELQSLAAVEQLSAFAYAHVLAAASLSAASASRLRTFLAHEREHLRLLSDALVRAGMAPPRAPADIEAANRQLSALHVPGSLQQVRSEDDALHYMIGVETLAEGAYYSAMSRLSDDSLLVLAAQVMSCEAQHWTGLSDLLHAGDVYRSVPYPVVLG